MLNCKKENCTGCGVCAYSCPKSAINMVESVEGFLYPKVDRSLCVDCNLCNKVCPSLKKPSIGDFADCYAVQLINKTTLRHCASGGAFYGIAQTVLEQNGAIFGVVDFGTELRYQKATSLKELDELTGSKYFQCAISEKAYGEIIESTQKGLTLVSGTPCMVAAIRNLQRINRKNLLTFEILCQGVPSKTVIEKFYSEMAAKYGSPVQNHVFRSKDRYIGRIYVNRYDQPAGKPYTDLLELVRDRDFFVITTNVDHQFQLAGFEKQRLFYTQGDYGLWQCSKACHDKTYDNEPAVREMLAEQRDMRIPEELIPQCPVCGAPMTMNLRCGDSFVQDEGWYAAAGRYEAFLHRLDNRHVLFLELGVGGNTPGIFKYPFWRMTAGNPQAAYICINRQEAFCPREIQQRSLCLGEDIGKVLADCLLVQKGEGSRLA